MFTLKIYIMTIILTGQQSNATMVNHLQYL